jgi:alpha-tubulin suppressor-like RCC1 family protein
MDALESYFDHINDELTHITKHLAIADIINMSLVNSKFNRCLWQDDLFWLSRLTYELGSLPDTNESEYENKWSKESVTSKWKSWRNLYFNSFNIWVIGDNSVPRLGIMSNSISQLTQIPNFKAVQIKSSDNHTIAIDLNNNVHVWGSNQFGELGLGDTKNRKIPTLLPVIKSKSITCGPDMSFIVDSEDKLLGFGHSGYLGLGYSGDLGLLKYGGGKPALTPHSILPFKIKEVSSSGSSTVVQDFEDRIWGWGSNLNGQLCANKELFLYNPGLLTDFRVKQIAAGTFYTLIIDYNDNVWACGLNRYGQLGLGTINSASNFTKIEDIKAKKVICGQNSSAIINFNNELFMFGSNNLGQLGLGDTVDRLIPTKVSNLKIKDVSMSYDHTIMLDMEGNVWVCGMKWENFTKSNLEKYKKNNIVLTPRLLSKIKARKILALNDGSIIIGIIDQ